MSTTQVRGDTTRTGLVIEHLERLTLSTNGNPRFRVYFTDGTVAQTMSDASLGYCIENAEYRGVPLAVIFTVHGKIRHATPEPPEDKDELDDEESIVPDHHNDLGDWCPDSGKRAAGGTCPQFCREADDLAGYDAGDRNI